MKTEKRLMSREAASAATVFEYHERTKHHFSGYAKGPETIDWDQQPDSFRRYIGADLIKLPLETFDPATSTGLQSTTLNDVFSQQGLTPKAVSVSTLGLFLQHSLALSAWKQYGTSRWSLRCNPSSGNLHPTEAYLIVRGVADLNDGIYHYRADIHSLEFRAAFASNKYERPELFIALSSVHWCEAWKYGERAYRYCQHDVGHAVAALAVAGTFNHWTLTPEQISHSQLDKLLGFHRQCDFIPSEEEWGDCLLRVDLSAATTTVEQISQLSEKSLWFGHAALLDKKHFYQWPVVDEVAQAIRDVEADCLERETVATTKPKSTIPTKALQGDYRDNLSMVIRQRRSAQAFDGVTSISQSQFFVILDHLLPRDVAPWSSLPLNNQLHLVLFVHRVEGLPQGLYVLPRSSDGETLLRAQCREQFAWQPVDSAPEHLPLYQLIQAKTEKTAIKLSCQQPIAGNSAFSLAMLAEFEGNITDTPERYPQLFWEAGAIGQQLYLEAEAIGLSGTGIGCYFDDAVHDLLGITNLSLQSLYHFTVGGALKDNRIISFPPYHDRK